jgi:hypothetical protein
MLKRRELTAFFGLSFALAWSAWGLAHPQLQQHLGLRLPADPLVMLGTAVPSFVALGLATWRGRGRELLSRLIAWRVNAGWYALASIGPPILMLAATAIHVALGGDWPDYPPPERWSLFPINFVAVLMLGGPLGEELGWRGYALPMMTARIGLARAGTLIGLAWAAWHLPLFLLPSSPQAGLPLIWFGLQAVALSLVLAVVWQGTGGNLLLPVLLHASVNAFSGPLRVLPADAGSTQPYILTVLLTWACAIGLLWGRIPSRPQNGGLN